MSSRKPRNSSSDEDLENRYAMINDEKKRKRMISNRESARRSRMKREQHIKDLNDQNTYFSSKRKEMVQKIDETMQRYFAIESENKILRMRGEELKRRLKLMDEMLVSHNNSSYVYDHRATANGDEYSDTDILQRSLLKTWLQTPFQPQAIDGIYQF